MDLLRRALPLGKIGFLSHASPIRFPLAANRASARCHRATLLRLLSCVRMGRGPDFLSGLLPLPSHAILSPSLTQERAMKTNIKGLPAGKEYFTECGHSDRHPWVVIEGGSKVVKLARVHVTRDPDWKPEFHSGGFTANCSNQSEQTWIFDRIDKEDTKAIRLIKSPFGREEFMWSSRGVRFLPDTAVEFYDYNF